MFRSLLRHTSLRAALLLIALSSVQAWPARALVDTDKDAETIVRRSLDIAADICVYTNRNITIETLGA